MKATYFIIIALVVVNTATFAQYSRFTTQGVIEYEKKINTYALIKDQIKQWDDDSFSKTAFENYQKTNPQFKTVKSKLTFNSTKTVFKPEEEAVAPSNNWFSLVQTQQNNIILTNIKDGTNIINKNIYEEKYLITDSTRKINWKITDEFRNIAGYNCRRANALVMDSIYVVAFYTDQIAVSGGPETFNGLPGMILGLALPHDHITWFATSVSDTPITDDKLTIPMKGKAVNNKQLYETLKSALKSWGKWANETFKWAML